MKELILQNIDLVAIAVVAIILVIAILNVVIVSMLIKTRKTYKTFLSGADGKSLEAVMLKRLKEVDELKEENRVISKSISMINNNLLITYQKASLLKYDAFSEMGGKLSFSLCLLDGNNDGYILTSMHSTREGCYIYVKEIIKGESYAILSKEEKQVLEDAKKK